MRSRSNGSRWCPGRIDTRRAWLCSTSSERRSGAAAIHNSTACPEEFSPLERCQHLLRERRIEVVRDEDLPLVLAEETFPLNNGWHEARDRLAGFRDHDFFPAGYPFEQAGHQTKFQQIATTAPYAPSASFRPPFSPLLARREATWQRGRERSLGWQRRRYSRAFTRARRPRGAMSAGRARSLAPPSRRRSSVPRPSERWSRRSTRATPMCSSPPASAAMGCGPASSTSWAPDLTATWSCALIHASVIASSWRRSATSCGTPSRSSKSRRSGRKQRRSSSTSARAGTARRERTKPLPPWMRATPSVRKSTRSTVTRDRDKEDI